MFQNTEIKLLRGMVCGVTGIALDMDIDVAAGEGLHVVSDGKHASIEACDRSALARGFFLLCRMVKENRGSCDIAEKRHFASCGPMIDMSRGMVMKPEAVKQFIDRTAALGMNFIMLYTEDTYEIPEYPRFGYLRGRYSQAELRDLDAYAEARGVELIPCIQTLGHMTQFLQWPENFEMQDQPGVLMCDDENVYQLIEAEIRAVRSCLRSRRIHIGMDEAHGVGLGRYYEKHGFTDRFALLNRHLRRVTELCRDYDFEPIMWSDMFFRVGSETNEYYDLDAVIPEAVVKDIPDVDLCYWDYYHTDEAFYEAMLERHLATGRKTSFAGGIWTWSGFLPNVKRAEAVTLPALKVCARKHIDTVLATLWNDDGGETDFFSAIPLLALFSEFCWQGEGCTMEEIKKAGECISGTKRALTEALGEFYPTEKEQPCGKNIIWGDILYPAADKTRDALPDMIRRAESARALLLAEAPEDAYALLLFEIISKKGALMRDIRAKYAENDRAYFAQLRDSALPELCELYNRLMRAHRELWNAHAKRFGWEVICARYGGAQARMQDIADEIDRWLKGEIPSIEELDQAIVPVRKLPLWHARLFTPSAQT